MMTKHCNGATSLTAAAGICLHAAIDRVTARHLADSELLGDLLLDELQRRGLALTRSKFLSLSLDETQPLPVLLQPQGG